MARRVRLDEPHPPVRARPGVTSGLDGEVAWQPASEHALHLGHDEAAQLPVADGRAQRESARAAQREVANAAIEDDRSCAADRRAEEQIEVERLLACREVVAAPRRSPEPARRLDDAPSHRGEDVDLVHPLVGHATDLAQRTPGPRAGQHRHRCAAEIDHLQRRLSDHPEEPVDGAGRRAPAVRQALGEIVDHVAGDAKPARVAEVDRVVATERVVVDPSTRRAGRG